VINGEWANDVMEMISFSGCAAEVLACYGYAAWSGGSVV